MFIMLNSKYKKTTKLFFYRYFKKFHVVCDNIVSF